MPITTETQPRMIAQGSFQKIDSHGTVVHTHTTTRKGDTIEYKGVYYFDEQEVHISTTITSPSGASTIINPRYSTFELMFTGNAQDRAAIAAASACSHMDVGAVYTPSKDAAVIAAGSFEKTGATTVRHLRTSMDGETTIKYSATYDLLEKSVHEIVRKISPTGELDGYEQTRSFTQMFNGTLEQQAALSAAKNCAAMASDNADTPAQAQTLPQNTTLRVPKLDFKAGKAISAPMP